MIGRILWRGGAVLQGAVLAAALASGAVAQTTAEDDDAPIPSPPGTVLSDAAPLPAEDRESQGAILLKHSPVRAQRATAVDETGAGVRAIGHGVTQVLGGPPSPATDAQPQESQEPQQPPKN